MNNASRSYEQNLEETKKGLKQNIEEIKVDFIKSLKSIELSVGSIESKKINNLKQFLNKDKLNKFTFIENLSLYNKNILDQIETNRMDSDKIFRPSLNVNIYLNYF